MRLETIASVNDRPENVVWEPTRPRSDLDRALSTSTKARSPADFGRLAFTTPPLAAIHSVDAKYTTSAMAKRLESFAIFGPPLGKPWEPTEEEKKISGNSAARQQSVDGSASASRRAIPSWKSPPKTSATRSKTTTTKRTTRKFTRNRRGMALCCRPATRMYGSQPRFAKYERLVATDMPEGPADDHKLTAADREKLALVLEAHRKSYLDCRPHHRRSFRWKRPKAIQAADWYRVAVGKGVLLLQRIAQDRSAPLSSTN